LNLDKVCWAAVRVGGMPDKRNDEAIRSDRFENLAEESDNAGSAGECQSAASPL
jgi:hypothetical protein